MEKSTITINKKIIELEKIVETNSDIIVPDSKPDIINIINANSNSYICSEDFSNGKYRFEGNSNVNIIYLSDKGEMQCIQTKINFIEFVENEDLSENTIAIYKIDNVKTDAKMINERKVNVSVKMKIQISLFEKNEMDYFNSFDNLDNIEKLEENMEISTIVVQNKINTSLQEELTLEENKNALNILKSSIEITNIENKISYNKLLTKADVNIKVMYLDQNLNLDTFSASIPITNFIDMEKINEENTCEINYKIRNVSMIIDSQNNNKINCKADFEVFAVAYEKKEITVTQDMYGINKKIEYKSRGIEIQKQGVQERENITISENILVEDIRQIYDVEYRIDIINHVASGNCYNYEAELYVDIYYNTGNYLCVKSVVLPFMFKMNGDYENLEYNFTKKHFKLINEDVVINLGIEFVANNNECSKINFIYEVNELEDLPESDYSMIVYFVKPGDTLWKIAKSFGIQLNKLAEINNLENVDKLYPGDKLYILK